MKRLLLMIGLIALLLGVITSGVSAQVGGPDPDGVCRDAAGGEIPCPDGGGGSGGSVPDSGDPDGDGTVAPFDNCPTLSGPNNNAGCPAGDEDGDGVANESDTCPLEAGAVGGNGCPEAADATSVPDSTVPEATTEPNTSVALPEIPADGRCMAATVGQAAVNVRVQPDQNAAVVGALDPSQTYAVVLQWMGPDGLWYRIANPAGWVFSGVTRLGGDCANIQTLDPAAASGAVPNWGPNGELTFCQPNYELGEDTCVPSPENTQASYVPNWDALGNLTFCIPDYEIGEEWCVVMPEGVVPNWGPNGEITFCIADPMDELSCASLLPDPRDGGIIMCAIKGQAQTMVNNTSSIIPPNPCVQRHKLLLVGEDGLIVLTDAPSTDPTA
ncbi:MAG: SH3 domain-containing protein, partial [Burkholderiales bacterium]|nr:SH3 domain-containing protein [Anaerolineae bacterium]